MDTNLRAMQPVYLKTFIWHPACQNEGSDKLLIDKTPITKEVLHVEDIRFSGSSGSCIKTMR